MACHGSGVGLPLGGGGGSNYGQNRGWRDSYCIDGQSAVTYMYGAVNKIISNSRASKVFVNHQQAKQNGCIDCFAEVSNV